MSLTNDHVTKVITKSGLTKIIINNDVCEAEIYLHGGHLTHYRVHSEEALIFDAKSSQVTPPKSVHAGIPICWPWFGAHPTDSSKPQHGFARDKVWQLKSTKAVSATETEVILTLSDDKETHTLFPYAFKLELTFTIAKHLTISLKTINIDTKPFSVTQALHTYFLISDIQNIQILGIVNTPFIDYTDERKEKREKSPLTIDQEVNRVYVPTKATCTIIDGALKRKVVIEKSGSNSTTIWNPWRESDIHDLPEDKYRKFICVETTNALEDKRTLQPDESHTIEQKIFSEQL